MFFSFGELSEKLSGQARNQLGTPGGAKRFPRGAKMFLNYVQHIFLGEAKNFLGGLRPFGYGPVSGY